MALNGAKARYLVVGGMAIVQQGYLRATEDIDLLVEGSLDNIERVRRGLLTLPDQAVLEMTAEDLQSFKVVRIVDDLVVDLMLETCGYSYQDVEDEIEWKDLDGARIPFASVPLLFKMKQTGREKDQPDLLFLRERLAGRASGADS